MIRLAAVLALLCGPAWGQACADRESITKSLTETYKEHRRSGGVVSERQIFEIWVSEAGTWTILRTHSNGVSCVIASGDGWRDFKLPQGLPG